MTVHTKLLFLSLSLFLLTTAVRPTVADDKPAVPALSAPVQELADRFRVKLQSARCMAQTPQPTTYPGYEGLPLVLCSYSVTDHDKPGGTIIGQFQFYTYVYVNFGYGLNCVAGSLLLVYFLAGLRHC